MNRDIVWTTQFKKDYKLAMKRNLDITLIDDCIRKLAAREVLSPNYRDHDLSGNWIGHRECHIQSEWLKCRYRHLSHYADFSVMPMN